MIMIKDVEKEELNIILEYMYGSSFECYKLHIDLAMRIFNAASKLQVTDLMEVFRKLIKSALLAGDASNDVIIEMLKRSFGFPTDYSTDLIMKVITDETHSHRFREIRDEVQELNANQGIALGGNDECAICNDELKSIRFAFQPSGHAK